ncbi:penicillin-binding protein 2 [Sphingomonas sp.]|uniref:penicillin-binding protein 2 n=1 Tax=Sphingomonas sp. TaxID=28214 RepID=UPI001D4D9283|nr:penicillin-binding protein 2 [Sphingomonas sp.]MBX9797733.1 penicillin-binding protein 2 [Sphingomonas sp.]
MNRQTKIVTEAAQNFSFSRRTVALGLGQAAVGVVLAGRMGWLSIAENARYEMLAESNRVNLTMVPPRRGWIMDRHNTPIANNRTDFRVDIIRDRLRDPDRVLGLLANILSLKPEDVERIRLDLKGAAGFQPVEVADNLAWEQFAAISVRLPELPGVAPTRGYSRNYPLGAAVAHLTGYVGIPSADQYRATKDPLYVTPGFKVGKDGIEKTLEQRLRGTAGAKRVEVTAHGKLVRELAARADVPGQTVRLTIDAGLQEYAARRLGTNSGSAVVIDCQTGDVLAMVSMPAYDPNSFSDGISKWEWRMLSDNDHVPLMNKTLQGLYPPGSTVKPMNALALLHAGISPNDRVVCSGALRVGSGVFHCHKRRGHGAIDLKGAVAQSCDIYFYEMARRLGYDRFAPMLKTLGMGQKFELPFASQRYGTVPDSTWKLKKYKENWTVADSLNASIGQGYVLANPMQLAVAAARLASGLHIEPRLFMDGNTPRPAPLQVDPDHFATVRAAMHAVVNGGGTAGSARLNLPGIELAAKTGTAQVRRITMAERARGVLGNAALPFKLRDHALFICFAPADKPRYAMGMVLEHNGHVNRAQDTPLTARDIMTYLFDKDRALAALAEVEPGWGGDIATRMAAEATSFRAAMAANAQGQATEMNAAAATESQAVNAASAASNAAAATLGNSADGGVAAESTEARNEP